MIFLFAIEKDLLTDLIKSRLPVNEKQQKWFNEKPTEPNDGWREWRARATVYLVLLQSRRASLPRFTSSFFSLVILYMSCKQERTKKTTIRDDSHNFSFSVRGGIAACCCCCGFDSIFSFARTQQAPHNSSSSSRNFYSKAIYYIAFDRKRER